MRIQTIAMIGGTGFIGRHLASELTRRGYALKLLTRRRERTKQVIVFPRLELVDADVHNAELLKTELAGCDAVINLAGILNEHRGGDFERVHARLPQNIVAACEANGIHRFLHMSALKASTQGPSQYLSSKAKGEAAALAGAERGVDVTVFRPSVVFGPEDEFFNRFAALLQIAPVLPLACPKARFAPVYVEDVALAFANALTDKSTFGEAYNLCGPEQFTLSDLVHYTGRVTGHDRAVIGLPDFASRLQGAVMGHLPKKLFTMDNYLSMQVPSTCDGDDLAELGIHATGIDSVVPGYLGHRNKQARYAVFRAHARRD